MSVVIHPAVAAHPGETLDEIVWLSEERRKALIQLQADLELARTLQQRAEQRARQYENAALIGVLLAAGSFYPMFAALGDWLLG